MDEEFGLSRRAHSRKSKQGLRALLGGRAPDAREIGERLGRLARRTFGSGLRDATPKRVTAMLHPRARPLRIAVLDDATLDITAPTAAIGPGYHDQVFTKIAPLLDELEYVLDDGPRDDDPQVAMTEWLANRLRDGIRAFGMPPHRTFRCNADLLTPLGPRDAAWRAAVIDKPMVAADAFAWWDRGPGREPLSRALLAMWHEVPWRAPFDDDERELLAELDRDLASAYRADPALPIPWPEWAEVRRWLGRDDEQTAEVVERAEGQPAVIGYRRFPIEVALAGGWQIEVPGSFVSHLEDDGARWWATDGERVIEFTSLTADGELDSQQLLEVAAPIHPVIEQFADHGQRGRAEAYDDGAVRIVHGLMACAPEVAIVTCKGRAIDERWALATWRSLRHVSG